MTENKNAIFGLSPHNRGEFFYDSDEDEVITFMKLERIPFYIEINLDQRVKLNDLIYV